MIRHVWAAGLALAAIAAVAAPAHAGTTFSQDFETDTSGWTDSSNGWYGSVTRVASGTGGITSAGGSWHAIFDGDSSSAPFTNFGGYSSVWPGTYSASVDIYLDTSWAAGSGFDYTVASSRQTGAHLRDFIFHVTQDTSTGELLVAGSNNTNFAVRQDLENINHYSVTNSGWYTFEHVFYDDGSGVLAVDLNLRDSNGTLLFTETRSDAGDLIASVVGGNRYGWFTFIDVRDGIAVDNTCLGTPVAAVPLPPAALLGMGMLGGLGLIARRRRRAQIA